MTTTQKFYCIFCKDVFDNKEELQDHFRKHADPKFKNKNRFEIDSHETNEKCKEKSELVSCDVCPQVFPTISKAITHKHKVHPDHDAKYFCPWCGKLFTLKHLYNVHVQSTHAKQEKIEDTNFHCDNCEVDFYLPSAMTYHNKFFHRQDTDMPDIGQSKKFKLFNQEVIPIYYCAFCGEEYDNKVNLFKHVTDDHGDENQSPEEVLRCPLCEAIFYHLDAYEIHLTFHTPEDLYSVKNDLFGELSDFSLETVPPAIEKVELFPPEDSEEADPESAMNAVGIDKFLELAMDQSEDTSPVKPKKHKKHKKSKKAAITLDEFLSMNQDVFGEGLDFQGVEEIPTRIVKKHLKTTKKPAEKSATSAEIEKLKKQGIVIKKKTGPKPKVQGLKPMTIKPRVVQNKTNLNRTLKTSSEVLSKLINQSNNQIKIVKKSIPENTNNKTDETKNIIEETDTIMKNNDDNDITSQPDLDEENEDHNETDELKKKDDSPNATYKEPISPPTLVKPDTDIKSDENEELDNTNTDKSTLEVSDPEKTETSVKPASELNSAKSVMSHQKISELECDDHVSDTENDTDNCDKFDQGLDDSNKDKVIPPINPLSTLQHLSHLITVKPVAQSKNTAIPLEPVPEKMIQTKGNQSPQTSTSTKDTKDSSNTNNIESNRAKPKVLVDKDPTFDALKSLSKNITIKSMPTSTKMNIVETEFESDDKVIEETETQPNQKLKDVNVNKNITIKKIKVDTSELMLGNNNANALHSPQKMTQSGNLQSKTNTSKLLPGPKPTKVVVETVDNNIENKINTDILKRLPNITSKPIITKKAESPAMTRQVNLAKRVVQKEEKKEEVIEIFDIDDSDDEKHNTDETPTPEPTRNSTKSMDALKNLSKHITVKSLNQPTVHKNIKIEKDSDEEDQPFEDLNNHMNDSNDEEIPINPQNSNLPKIKACNQKLINKNMAFKNALHNLSKNITVKSRTSSPSQSVKSQDHNTQDTNFETNDASDSDSESGKVKISEVDDDISDTDLNTENDLNPIVESPHDSCSENEDFDEDIQDFESVKVNTVSKSNQNVNTSQNSVYLNNLKNVNKNITIKSLNKTENEENSKSQQLQKRLEIQNSQKHPSPLKLPKPSGKESPAENILVNRTSKNSGQVVNHSSNQSMNQKMSSINQVQNTVNKEVTVKTIQTKTVIQEITTTVTKTIKTLNQTVQEVRNTNQTSNSTVSQKIIGVRPSLPKNLQGVVIRHATPTIAPKSNNTVAHIRPTATVVRPSKQVAVKPGVNLARPSNPRMPAVKRAPAGPSIKPQVLGKTLKISPNAMTSSIAKRPNSEDVSGPFSCFKKPKESLIPVSDVPNFGNNESTAQFTATSHSSSSNFTSTAKLVKGNSSMMTSTQMKSEVHTSSQQMSRLAGTSGLKVTSSQVKQSQVLEKSETSAMKRTTLEAIQKLQKQGLLVKKPRVDVNEGSGECDLGSDDNVDYNSDDEQDA